MSVCLLNFLSYLLKQQDWFEPGSRTSLPDFSLICRFQDLRSNIKYKRRKENGHMVVINLIDANVKRMVNLYRPFKPNKHIKHKERNAIIIINTE